MKTYLDCIPCFFSQAIFAAKSVGQDDVTIKKILDRLGSALPGISLNDPPPESGRVLYQIVSEITGIEDPFRSLKIESTQKALELYPSLKERVKEAPDPLEAAVRLAMAGNVIDFGANRAFRIEQEIDLAFHEKPGIDHFKTFKQRLSEAENVLYLGDNAGETVFDRVLIETMGKPVTYAVRERPIINDAVYEDAVESGLDRVAEIISSGCDAPGTILKRCSGEFRRILEKADLIISKGQGNFEALYGEPLQIFFLLKIKCRTVAGHLGRDEGSFILMEQRAG